MKETSKGITTPIGFSAASTSVGIKPSGKPDMTMIVADRVCNAAGVFTRNRSQGAALAVDKAHLRSGQAQVIVANSGNANAATGTTGNRNAIAMTTAAATTLDQAGTKVNAKDVLPSSTGVIGVQLPMVKIHSGISQLVEKLHRGPKANQDAARGIMTTDLVPKGAYRRLRIHGQTVHLAAIAKGSGMICPNMATMLAFLTTDAVIEPKLLRVVLRQAVTKSFNCISVDQHTSPCDTVLLLASGGAAHRPIGATGKGAQIFSSALLDLCQDLAYQIIADGEGATKILWIQIKRAARQTDADRVAKAIVDSPMVKTGMNGEDPSCWGRIVTAAGYSGAPVDPDRMSLSIAAATGRPGHSASKSSITVYRQGLPAQLNRGTANRLQGILHQKEIHVTLDLGQGTAKAQWLGCDLSHDYVTLNTRYTT